MNFDEENVKTVEVEVNYELKQNKINMSNRVFTQLETQIQTEFFSMLLRTFDLRLY